MPTLYLFELTEPRYRNHQNRDKEWKKQSKKHRTLSSHINMRRSISTKLGMMVEERAIITSPGFIGSSQYRQYA